MSHPSKVRGTRWESAVRDWLSEHGYPAFRPALHGAADKGDLFGIGNVTIQCKDTAKIDLAGAVDDAIEQAHNAGTDHFVVIQKRRRRGVGQAYVVTTLERWVETLKR